MSVSTIFLAKFTFFRQRILFQVTVSIILIIIIIIIIITALWLSLSGCLKCVQ